MASVFVVLHADAEGFRADDPRGETQAVEHGLGLLEHDAMVRAQIRLAFRAVEDDRINALLRRRREFNVRWKGRAAHADHARFANRRKELGRVVRVAHGHQGSIPLVQGVVFDDDGLHAAAAGDDARLYGLDNARTGECTAALTKPSGAAIFWPISTGVPGRTSGFAGAPTCCESGTATTLGAAALSMGSPRVSSFPPAASRGCTPRH